MKKLILYIIGLTILIIAVPTAVVGYVVIKDMLKPKSKDKIMFEKRLLEVVNSGATELRPKDLTEFEWDRVCINLPDNPDTYQVDWSMKNWSISFYYKSNVGSIKYIEISRKILDLKPLRGDHGLYCYKQDVVFKLEGKDLKLIILE